ncbi:site-specific integrase [uncultured Ruminococcus sp.]|uniref:site-specific integrase n=1 Tax=uncultured Ruminococcus sp. TaxID=165186 RepID=UPI0025D1988D|nr:site-specific integrase [uncultured Ruminococcus sp.]
MKAVKLPSGSYRTQVVVGKDENGKRIVKSFTADKEWEAIKLADEYMENNAINVDSKRMTVRQAFSQYIEARDNILSPSTIRGYKIIRNSRLQFIMDMNIHEVKLNDVQKAVNFDSKRLSRKSIKSSVSLLKSVLEAQDIELKIKKITIPQEKGKKQSIPDATAVLKAIIGTDIELPCMLAMWLSLRISEVRGLQFRDISEDGKYITVCRARICLDGRDVVRDQNKTEESTRTNPLPPYLFNLIQQIPHENDTDFIVTYHYETIRRKFNALMEQNGFNITFHKLRHEFATTLNDLGIPGDYIQKLGGWATDNVMKSVYTHTTAAKEMEYQTLIDNFFVTAINSTVQSA